MTDTLLNKNAKVLITGGTGFVGSHMVEYLLAEGYSNIAVTTQAKRQLNAAVTQFEVDLTIKAAVLKCFEEYLPEIIINLAAIASVGDSFEQPEKLIAANSSMMISVVEAMRQVVPSARMLHVSSAAVYGVSESESELPQSETHPLRPINPYAVSKVTQEFIAQAYARSYNLAIVYARPFNHIGERQTSRFAIPAFAEQIVAVEEGTATEVKVGDLSAVHDFLDVKDVIKAYMLLLEKGVSGEIYNIGSGHGRSMEEMLGLLIQQSLVPISIRSEEHLLRPLDIPVSIADNKKISQLGWEQTIKIEETVQRIITWQRKERKKL